MTHLTDLAKNATISFDDYVDYRLGQVYVDLVLSAYGQQIDRMVAMGHELITVFITSGGGAVDEGLAIVRSIQRAQASGCRVRGVVRGQACSMAFTILQACDERIMHQGDVLMAHGITAGMMGDASDFEAHSKMLDYWRDHIAQLYVQAVERANPYSPAARRSYWVELLKRDTPNYYTADEALYLGFVDKVEG